MPEEGPKQSLETEEKASAPTTVQPVEPSDPYQAGGQPEQQRDALKLNVEGKQAQSHSAGSTGLHATGSIAGSPENTSPADDSSNDPSATRS
ncbi:MAG TPA: hypothetical protein VGD59_06550 [Acidisarcina sp.]